MPEQPGEFTQNADEQLIRSHFPVQWEQTHGDLTPYVMMAITLGEQTEPTTAQERTRGTAALINTINFVDTTVLPQIGDTETVYLSFQPAHPLIWSQGIYTLDVAWKEPDQSAARLLEIGLAMDADKHQIIYRAQPHLLGNYLGRSQVGERNFDTATVLAEKEQGDRYLHKIHERTGLSSEEFGLLISISVLLDNQGRDHQPQTLVFPTIDAHPEVTMERERLWNAQKGDSESPQLQKIRKSVDFASMLQKFGVTEETIKTEGNFLSIDVEDLKPVCQFIQHSPYLNQLFSHQ